MWNIGGKLRPSRNIWTHGSYGLNWSRFGFSAGVSTLSTNVAYPKPPHIIFDRGKGSSKGAAKSRCFNGAWLDSRAPKSVIGLPQAKAYALMNRNTLALKNTKVKFKFGNTVHQSLGTMEFNLQTPDGLIGLTIDILDVASIIGIGYARRTLISYQQRRQPIEEACRYEGSKYWMDITFDEATCTPIHKRSNSYH
jgi:hypothetical protein